MSERFRWARFEDGSGEPWSRWHARSGPCRACCCGGVSVCSECGGREHQEPGEPVSVWDTVHIRHCEGCREDYAGEKPTIETEAAAADG